jgi:hypothetical protein
VKILELSIIIKHFYFKFSKFFFEILLIGIIRGISENLGYPSGYPEFPADAGAVNGKKRPGILKKAPPGYTD